jgi:hypothetical protein
MDTKELRDEDSYNYDRWENLYIQNLVLLESVDFNRISFWWQDYKSKDIIGCRIPKFLIMFRRFICN